ncbi:MAG: universal stress protein [Solirubrobacteraceae bacterium]
MFGNVVVGTDGRSGGRDALALANQLIAAEGEMLLAHVDSDGQGVSEPGPAERLDHGSPKVHTQLCSTVARSTSQGLHQLAEEHRADLLVLGCCRRGLAGRALHGDDTRASVDHLTCAAAVAPKGYAQSCRPIATIGVGYDGTAQSEEILAHAQALASELGASVRALLVVGVSPAAYAQPASLGYTQSAPFALNETMDVLVQRAEREMATLEDVEGIVACGSPGQELADFSDSVDLLILGSSDRGPLRRLLLGSVTNHLLRTAHCPLLVLPRTYVSESPPRQSSAAAATRG